jgi:hypothetical protein
MLIVAANCLIWEATSYGPVLGLSSKDKSLIFSQASIVQLHL